MKRIVLGLLAATVLSASAWAEETPIAGVRDPRVRSVAYDPVNVVRVQAADLRSTMLQFGDDETIDVVAIGDQAAWSFSKVRNLLFLRPSLYPARRTNAQVVTLRKDGSQRVYQLDLVPVAAVTLAADGPNQGGVFAIDFRYPTDLAAARRKAAAERTAQIATERSKQRLETAYFTGVRNWAYVARGSVAIQPAQVSDNGRTTVFRFPGNTRQPAIYEITPDGKEQIASVTNDSDLVIAHTTARGWRLRTGDEVCDVWNIGFDPVGENPRTGTVLEEVIRTIRGTR